MPIKPDQTITLKNGYKLGYAEIGAPDGQPVLHFHGMPSSRMEVSRLENDRIASDRGARVIAVERPGIGLSDFYPYQITSWPDIVIEFSDQLNLPRFSVIGGSSGGKYAAVCAWKISHRLKTVCIVSGNAPVDIPEVIGSMSTQDRILYFLARRANGLLRLLLGKIAADARKDPNSVLSLLFNVSKPDKNVLKEKENQKQLQRMITGAFQSGTRGVTWDWRLEALPWGFSLSEIQMPVSIWHGEEDTLVPVAHGRYMARAIPHNRTNFISCEGHLSLATRYYGQILEDVMCR